MTAPGDLNRRLVLQAPAETPDGAGGVTRGYTAVTTLWASVEPVSARNGVIADAGGATYRIVSLRDDATRRFLVIGAEQRAD